MRKMVLRASLGITALLLVSNVLAQSSSNCLPDGMQSDGATYQICMPTAQWNGGLLIFAHGYVATDQPLGIPEDQLVLPDGTNIPALINSLGYAFAVSGYSVNGLAVLQGMADSLDLVNIFTTTVGQPKIVLIAGPSEGGLVTALSVERYPNVYAGGLAACGPIGDFPSEVNYLGNFRVVFDYFFPNIIPGSPISVPQDVMTNWNSVYLPMVEAAVTADPDSTAELLTVTGAAGGSNSADMLATVENVLWYSVFSTDDAEAKLGGQPFDNSKKIYTGSSNDFLLNLLVPRFTADPAAVTAMQNYNTTGKLTTPLVTMHTLSDPIVPYWNETLYTLKTISAGTPALRTNFPINAYGHCNFTENQALVAYLTMVLKTHAPLVADAQASANGK